MQTVSQPLAPVRPAPDCTPGFLWRWRFGRDSSHRRRRADHGANGHRQRLHGLARLWARASATLNGAAAADGTVVNFSAPSAVFVPAAPTSRAGVAASTLTSNATGPLAISASVTEGGQTGSATQTLYLRPEPGPMGILVPAYFTLCHLGLEHADRQCGRPSLGRHHGHRRTPATGYSVQRRCQLHPRNHAVCGGRGTVLGYVYTRYGKGQPLARRHQGEHRQYLQFYGRERIGGIFSMKWPVNFKTRLLPGDLPLHQRH